MKTVFIDLDGTLLNSAKRHVVVLGVSLEYHHHAIGCLEDYLPYKREGNSTRQYLMDKRKIETNIAEHINRWWIKHIEDDEYLLYDLWYDDVFSFLKYIKNVGYRTFLITARRRENPVFDLLDNSTIKNLIDEIAIVNPNKAYYEKNRVISSIVTNRDILIGDTEIDYRLALGSNIVPYMLNRGFRSINFWNKYEIRSYDSLYQIMEIINNEKGIFGCDRS